MIEIFLGSGSLVYLMAGSGCRSVSQVYKEMDILLERLHSTDSRIAGLTLRLLTDPQLVEVLSTEPELALGRYLLKSFRT